MFVSQKEGDMKKIICSLLTLAFFLIWGYQVHAVTDEQLGTKAGYEKKDPPPKVTEPKPEKPSSSQGGPGAWVPQPPFKEDPASPFAPKK